MATSSVRQLVAALPEKPDTAISPYMPLIAGVAAPAHRLETA